ncbi:glycosyltransferase [Curtobacterium flaccumfaciens pv. flaccumfaciens]|uniref:glycosyltransferase family 2 protein n=1 Tax=Curtobacterium flaccumfaciens TaxID=2035 RepID=UPI002659AB06|nr:glycosyltransferase [Curtobacterium flaccumfaciens]MCS5510902.1 glycosyltransferase [Curtobacterium flaccumfaciens pv. flaccumfaciens]MCX2787015.1 glycosyltransferase [Curtobacterium flaccumfaciens pv. flaccumfaciens]
MTARWSGSWAKAPDPADTSTVDVDVLIPTVGRPAELATTLAGLAAQTDVDLRVVLSDQSADGDAASAPAVAAMLRVLEAQGRPVTLLTHPERRGLAEHRQFLLDHAEAAAVLFLDDDVWLEPGSIGRMLDALRTLGCGFVGSAVQGLSYLQDRRPHETSVFERWDGPVVPEVVRRGTPGFDRWSLHNAANPTHVAADLDLRPGEWVPYRVAWVGACALYDRRALEEVGGFRFWDTLPPEHAGEDVVAQWRVMERFGGAGIMPSGAVHLEAPTTVVDRRVDAPDVVFADGNVIPR